MAQTQSKTIVFVTGAFVSYIGWAEWKAYFAAKGYHTHTPAWPYKEDAPALLRANHPDNQLASLTFEQLLNHHVDFIKALPEKPIIIGHSLGGLLTQLLVQKGLATAAVIYHSVAPQGVLSFEFSFLKSLWAPLGIFHSASTPFLMSFKQWQYTFTNGMDVREQQHYYDELVVPESRKVMRGALTGIARVNFKKPHVPLLFMSGETDHIMPASLNHTNYLKYKKQDAANGSVTEYKTSAGRNHLAMAHEKWQEDADYMINWLRTH